MRQKKVSVSIQGGRYEVKGWGIEELPGLTLTAVYGLVEGKLTVFDKKVTVLIHDRSGGYICYFTKGIKKMGKALKDWKGGGVDWQTDSDGLAQGEYRVAIGLLHKAVGEEALNEGL